MPSRQSPPPFRACLPQAPSCPRGFSLIELLLVLGVVAVLLVAMFVVYPEIRLTRQVNAEMLKIERIGDALEYGAAGKPLTSIAQMAAVLRASGLDELFLDPYSNAIETPWGFASVRPAHVPGAMSGRCWQNPRSFEIRYMTVPEAVCTKMFTRMLASPERYSRLYVMGLVAGGTTLWDSGRPPIGQPPPRVDEIATACRFHAQESQDAGKGEQVQLRVCVTP